MYTPQFLRAFVLTLGLLAGTAQGGQMKVDSLDSADCFLANPDVFEVMTGWVTTTEGEKCLLAFPNQGNVKTPTIKLNGRRLSLISLETLSLRSEKSGGWQKLIRMKSQDGAVRVVLRYRVNEDLCKNVTESSCYPPKYGEMDVTNGVERYVVPVQQLQ